MYEPYSQEEINSKFEECKKTHDDVYVEFELDYGGCYYEGDTPSVYMTFYGEPKDVGSTKIPKKRKNVRKSKK